VWEHPGKAHNQFLSMATEVGIVGLLLFLFLMGWMVKAMVPGSVEAAVGISALCFFCLLSLLHDPLFHAPFSMALALCLGVGMSRNRLNRAV
jgi:O-antigen ligase